MNLQILIMLILILQNAIYYIISTFPNNGKQIAVDETIKHDRICNEIVAKIKAENKPGKYFYKLFIQ